MVQKINRPNISFRVDKEFFDEINSKAAELDITRSELLQHLVYNILKYPVTDKPFKTLTVGKLREILEPLPNELPLIAYTDNEDYALNELSLFNLIGGLKLEKLDKPVTKTECDIDDLLRE